jgi:hypothetical protein
MVHIGVSTETSVFRYSRYCQYRLKKEKGAGEGEKLKENKETLAHSTTLVGA